DAFESGQRPGDSRLDAGNGEANSRAAIVHAKNRVGRAGSRSLQSRFCRTHTIIIAVRAYGPALRYAKWPYKQTSSPAGRYLSLGPGSSSPHAKNAFPAVPLDPLRPRWLKPQERY